jgi:hypothetical protein
MRSVIRVLGPWLTLAGLALGCGSTQSSSGSVPKYDSTREKPKDRENSKTTNKPKFN